MDHLTFIARSKDSEELGSVLLNNEEIQGFLAVQDGKWAI